MSILTRPRTTRPERLYDLSGIGPQLAGRVEKHLNTMHREWRKYGSHDHLFSGINGQRSLYEQKEGLTETELLQVIERDPYLLVAVRGIGFKRADAIALGDYGIDHDDERRHEAGNQAAISSLGALPMHKYRKARERLELRNREHELAGVVPDHDLVWLPAELAAEELLADAFEDALTAAPSDTDHAIPAGLDLGPLNDDQRNAVRTAASGIRFMALTGGAGTGKTHTVAATAKAVKAQRRSMRVMAFAGKAAMRSAEAMREAGVDYVECSTIHRALHLQSQSTYPDPLLEDVIVLDEASMIPNWLMAKVVQALKPSATLILVGDPNQLPPIGHGTPFNDYLALGLPHLHLVQNYRQAGQVSIHQFAEAIREQDPSKWGGADQGVLTAFAVDPSEIEGTFNESVKAAAARHQLLEWQCVTWKNDTRHVLNQHLQELLNPVTDFPLFSYRLWGMKDEYGRDLDAQVYVGDKVLITDNEYEYEVFNGQTGIILDGSSQYLTVDLVDGTEPRTIPISDARDLMQLGYAVTVHKAQGSGWETVILYQPEPVTFSPRRFYYTSVTRAKNQVELWTTLSQRAWWTNVLQADADPDSTLIQRVEEAR